MAGFEPEDTSPDQHRQFGTFENPGNRQFMDRLNEPEGTQFMDHLHGAGGRLGNGRGDEDDVKFELGHQQMHIHNQMQMHMPEEAAEMQMQHPLHELHRVGIAGEEGKSHSSDEENSRTTSDIQKHPGGSRSIGKEEMQLGVGKKPRGRPPGSKNKPKPPVIITRDSEDAMRPHVFEIAGGSDVSDAVAGFARQRQRGLCVLSGSGAVANVSLRQPAGAAMVTFRGRFEILSLSGAILPISPDNPNVAAVGGGLTISMAGSQGQVMGGCVAGALLAAGPVLVIAASFRNPSFYRLPISPGHSDLIPAAAGGPSSQLQFAPTFPSTQTGNDPHQHLSHPVGAAFHHHHALQLLQQHEQQPPPSQHPSSASSSSDPAVMPFLPIPMSSSQLPHDVLAWAAAASSSRGPF